jgi:hypothetical protein
VPVENREEMEDRGRFFERDYYEDDMMPGYSGGMGPGQKRTDDKFRRLPCRTFICTGTCPYRERCVYLHDPRIISRNVKSKSRRKNKDDVVSDAWFWPVMLDEDLVTDHSSQPIVNQFYHVPLPRLEQANSHNRSVYSMWMHFVEFCIDLSTKPSEKASFSLIHSQHQVFCHPEELGDFRSGRKKSSQYVNMYTGEKRLRVFIQLGKGMGLDGSVTENCASSNAIAVSSLPVAASASPVRSVPPFILDEKVAPSPARFASHSPRIVDEYAANFDSRVTAGRSHEEVYERRATFENRRFEEVYANDAKRYELSQTVVRRKLDSVVPSANMWTKSGAPSGFPLPLSMSFW